MKHQSIIHLFIYSFFVSIQNESKDDWFKNWHIFFAPNVNFVADEWILHNVRHILRSFTQKQSIEQNSWLYRALKINIHDRKINFAFFLYSIKRRNTYSYYSLLIHAKNQVWRFVGLTGIVEKLWKGECSRESQPYWNALLKLPKEIFQQKWLQKS